MIAHLVPLQLVDEVVAMNSVAVSENRTRVASCSLICARQTRVTTMGDTTLGCLQSAASSSPP